MKRIIVHCPVLQQQRSLEECVAFCARRVDVRHKCRTYYTAIGHTSKEVDYKRRESGEFVELTAIIPEALFPVRLPKKAASTNSKELKKLFGARWLRGRVVYHYTTKPHAFTEEDLSRSKPRGGRIIIPHPNGWISVPSRVGIEYNEAFCLEWKMEKL